MPRQTKKCGKTIYGTVDAPDAECNREAGHSKSLPCAASPTTFDEAHGLQVRVPNNDAQRVKKAAKLLQDVLAFYDPPSDTCSSMVLDGKIGTRYIDWSAIRAFVRDNT